MAVSTTTVYEPHACILPSNFYGIVRDGTIERCTCGQEWRMKSGRFFWRWEQV